MGRMRQVRNYFHPHLSDPKEVVKLIPLLLEQMRNLVVRLSIDGIETGEIADLLRTSIVIGLAFRQIRKKVSSPRSYAAYVSDVDDCWKSQLLNP